MFLGWCFSSFSLKLEVDLKKDSYPCWGFPMSWVWGIQSLNAVPAQGSGGGAGSAMLGGGHGVFVLVTGCTRAWANWAGLCQHNQFLHLEMSELSSFGFLGRLPFAFLPASEQKPSSSCAKCLYVFPLSWGILSVEGLRKILLIFFKCGAN